ncbi:hypothetical protein [Roseimaritima ulvae]|uniref:Uncharacterized protein n=1 Tax=Roseimaritima ulvae TaxID=980254 RepID=A0A5B9QUG3_9BACT|nr:hypothetical protein [Roseimaritima ulvae]QEG42644.1 hypothetical protein UC8_46860 [Roseimaritima ulvae]
MIRWLSLFAGVLVCVGITAGQARCAGPDEISGELQFSHSAPDPSSATLCLWPIPGLAFNDVHGEFDGQATGIGSFTGQGTADTCVYFTPVSGVYAQVSGSFSWETEDGRTLSGSFCGVDKAPFLFAPDGQPLAFEITLLVVFRDTQGRFAGLAIADGVDDPFGVISQDPAAAGVTASICGFVF